MTPELLPMPQEAPLEGMIEQPPMESAALQVDDEEANATAVKIIASSKSRMYGEEFDRYMEVLQGSDNLVEDIAMISINLLVPEINAANSKGGVPFDYLMDASADIVSEAYDMAVQTGIYEPNNEEEVERNQNISLTMVAGELGKTFSSSDALPQGGVENFIESVMDGNYDNLPTEADSPPMTPELPPMMPEQAPMMPGQDPMMPGQAPMMPGQAPMPGEIV